MASHIVLASTAHLGHVRALCVLASRIIVEKEATVTVLVPNWNNIVPRLTPEVQRSLGGVSTKGNLRLIAYGESSTVPLGVLDSRPVEFEPVWRSLAAGEPVTCSSSGTVFPGVQVPKFIVIEQFMHPLAAFLRSHSPSVPIGLWTIGSAISLVRVVLPFKYGGVAEMILSLPLDLDKPVPIPIVGEIIRLPGIPAIYDHEAHPQERELAAMIMPFEANITRTTWEADFALTAFWDDFERDAITAYTSWMAERGKKTYHVGPLLPLQPGAAKFSDAAINQEVASAPGTTGSEIITFLNNSLVKYGPKSLIYIGFGTHFWPPKTEHLVAMLEAFTAHKIPFILTTPSPLTVFPEEVRKKYENSELGYIAKWAPQQTVLAHEATGWFVTHGGYNGAVEATSLGVPMIAWPIAADQPIQAINLERMLDVAFELKEVRGGHGLKPILQTGKSYTGTLEAFKKELETLIKDLNGPIGIRKRENVQKFRAAYTQTWDDGGSARKALDAFLETF